jgi:hypothetical protein
MYVIQHFVMSLWRCRYVEYELALTVQRVELRIPLQHILRLVYT